MLYENKVKTYVSVEVLFDEAGQMIPRAVQWEDGRVFTIDKVLDVRPAASLKAADRGCATPAVFGTEKRTCFTKTPVGLLSAGGHKKEPN